MAGSAITQPNDLLQKITIERFCGAVKQPKPSVREMIENLRKVRELSPDRYRELKKRLPYIVCGIFNPPYRKLENFSHISHFVIDLDHLSRKGLSIEKVISIFRQNPSTECCFVSPGEDGLKVMFKLDEPFYDPARYKLFYKLFVKAISVHYSLEQVTDNVTCDVGRACFISYDPEIWFNPECETVKSKEYIDFDDDASLSFLNSEEEKPVGLPAEKEEYPVGPGEKQLQEIKKLLGVRIREAPQKQIYVPGELEKVLTETIETLKQYQIVVDEVSNIHYGKKFKMHYQLKQAEVNLFYGKNGFVVVKSPRKGTDPELNDIASKILCKLFYGED